MSFRPVHKPDLSAKGLERLRRLRALAIQYKEGDCVSLSVVEALDACLPLCDALESERQEVERLRGVLEHIDGGDKPCTNEGVLRQWAYEGLTLGRWAKELSRP